MKKTFKQIVLKRKSNQDSDNYKSSESLHLKSHFTDVLSSYAQVIATIIAIFALLETIKQSKDNLNLAEKLSQRDSINRAKDAKEDSLKLSYNRHVDSVHFNQQIAVYSQQASALDSQFRLAKLQFNTDNVARLRSQLENKLQFLYQDSINKQQLNLLNKQSEALNRQSLIALKQAQLAEKEFFQDSILQADAEKNYQAEFSMDLQSSHLKFNAFIGFYRTIRVIFQNISDRSAEDVSLTCFYLESRQKFYAKTPEVFTPGAVKPGEARVASIVNLPNLPKGDTLAFIATLKYKDKLTDKFLPTVGCMRLLTKSNGQFMFPSGKDKQRILEAIKEKDSTIFKVLNQIQYQ
jgi:hypothetical protein